MNSTDSNDDSGETMPFVGVLVRPNRVEEGLRMASALALCDNEVEVTILGSTLAESADIEIHLDSLDIEEIPVRATFEDPRVETVTWQDIAQSLEAYDHVLTF